MASGSKRIMTGVVTAAAFVLMVGGLVAFGAGYFDGNQDTGANGQAEEAATSGTYCPATGCSDKESAAAVKTGAMDGCSDGGGCCPSMMKSGAASAAAVATTSVVDDCGGCAKSCEDAGAGCEMQADCDGGGSCESCSADN